MVKATRVTGRSGDAAATVRPDNPDLRPLLMFAAIALPIGWALLGASVALNLPTEPFALAATLFALLLPALIITARESGRTGVKRLLRDAVRLPKPWWWGLVALVALPLVVWSVALPMGGADPLTPSRLTSFAIGFLATTLIVNIWEETAWTGFVQRRSAARWGVVGGSLVTAALFAGIHLPLAFSGAETGVDVLTGIGILIGTAVGLRLIIAGLDTWSGRSLLTIGVLHGSFNVTPDLIDPAYDWIRYAAAVLFGIAVLVAVRVQQRRRARQLSIAE